jgi:hypothetical protein
MLARTLHSHRHLLVNSARCFSVATPHAKLNFIQHPRYGPVYPVIALEKSRNWYKTSMLSMTGLSIFNTSVIYSTFIMPIYTAVFSSIVANPIFMLPSLALNYYLLRKNYIYFWGDQVEVVNVWLKPSGKQIIAETRDGSSHTITTTDIYDCKQVFSKWESRFDFHYGANNWLYISDENKRIWDEWVFDKIAQKTFIDTRNVVYDFDLTKEFTWEFRDLVEIKKRKRVVDRVFKPTAATFLRL